MTMKVRTIVVFEAGLLVILALVVLFSAVVPDRPLGGSGNDPLWAAVGLFVVANLGLGPREAFMALHRARQKKINSADS